MIPASVGFQCPECVRAGAATMRPARRTTGLRSAASRWGTVTLSLIAANVAIFLVTAVSAGIAGFPPLDNHRSPIFADFSQVPLLVELGEPWRLLTAAFLHIGVVHLALNMLSLLVFGSELERQLGRVRFLALYVLSALGGSVAIQLFGEPLRQVAGASTAIYGLLGALGVLLVLRRQDVRGIAVLLAINVVISFLPGVSLLGHLGGLVTGALVTGVLVTTRRRAAVQAVALAAVAVVLVLLALTVPAAGL
jgi:membrane associated rhomboid family serine protease